MKNVLARNPFSIFAVLLVGLLVAVSAFVLAPEAAAQSGWHKFEGFAGYSFLHSDTGFNEATGIPRNVSNMDFNSHGFNASAAWNLHRYVGLKFDVSTHGRERALANGFGDVAGLRLRTTQFLGGVQIKDNSTGGGRFRPFAHALVGVAHQSISPTTSVSFVPLQKGSINDPAMAIGGGIDVNVSKRIALRLIQVDYDPIFRRDHRFPISTLRGRTQNNFRAGFGIVFH